MSHKAARVSGDDFKAALLRTALSIYLFFFFEMPVCRSSPKWDQVQHGEHLASFLLLSTALITQHNGDEICL